jgi:hypothetical protein
MRCAMREDGMRDPLDHLKTALDDRYTIERELGSSCLLQHLARISC